MIFPKGVIGDATVYVADGECWKPETRAFSEKQSRGTDFFAEVFVPQGTKLWVCAAQLPKKGRATIYGTAAESPQSRAARARWCSTACTSRSPRDHPVDPIGPIAKK